MRHVIGVFLSVSMAIGWYSNVGAEPVNIDTNAWSYEKSPSGNNISNNDVWTLLQENTPTKTGNSSGSLISDFSLLGDFTFSGIMQATFATNLGCTQANDNSCDDNDLMGIVFGWTDESNHYRLGFGQGGINDITGKNSLFLIEEKDGISDTLRHWENVFWQEQEDYTFEVSRLGDFLNIKLTGVGRSTVGTQGNSLPMPLTNDAPYEIDVDYTVSNTTWMNGKVGVYTESQTAIFSDLKVNDLFKVSEPYIFGMIGLGILILLVRRFAL